MIQNILLHQKHVYGVFNQHKHTVAQVQLEQLIYMIFTSHKTHGVHSTVITLKQLKLICLTGIYQIQCIKLYHSHLIQLHSSQLMISILFIIKIRMVNYKSMLTQKQQCIHLMNHYMMNLLIQQVNQHQHGYVLNYQIQVQQQVNNGMLVSMIHHIIQVGHITMNM